MPKSKPIRTVSSIGAYTIDYQRKFNAFYTEQAAAFVAFRQSERSKDSPLGKLPSDLMDRVFDFLQPAYSQTARRNLYNQVKKAAWPDRLLAARDELKPDEAKMRAEAKEVKFSQTKPLTLSNPRSEMLAAYNQLGQQVVIRRFVDVDPKRLETYLDKQQQLEDLLAKQQKSTILRFLEKVRDGSSFATVFENYQEDLPSFLERRCLKNTFLNSSELLLVTRHLVSGLSFYHDFKHCHDSIRIENIVCALNGQKQLVCKIADLGDEFLREEKSDLPTGLAWDVFCLGVVIYQIITLDNSFDLRALLNEVKDEKTEDTPILDGVRQALADPKGVIRQRYKEYPQLLDGVLQMLDRDPSKRPTPKQSWNNLAALKINIDDLKNPSVANEPIVPAGAGEQIVQEAKTSDEAKYQTALLLRERGHLIKCYNFAATASNQNHAKAHYLAARLLHNVEGCFNPENEEEKVRDFKNVKNLLYKAASAGIKEAQELLTDILFACNDHEDLLQCQTQKMSFSAKTLIDFALRYPADNPKELWLQAAEKGSALAQLYCGQFLRARKNADRYWCEQDERSFWASFFAFMPDYQKLLLHSFNLEQSEIKGGAKETTLDGVPVDVSPLLGAQIPKLLRRFRIPKSDHFRPMLGICAGLTSADGEALPLCVVAPRLSYNSLPDFFSKLKNRGKAVELFVPWAGQLASALEQLHAYNLVHRNLSASSIGVNEKQQLVLRELDDICYGPECPPVKIRRDQQKRLSCHLAPENPKGYTLASDIYAFGLTLFEIATECRMSFYDWSSEYADDVKVMAEIEAAASNTRDFAKAFLPSFVPDKIKDLICRCLHPDPSQRPSAKQLMTALEVDVAPVQASDISNQLYKAAMELLANSPVHSPKLAAWILRDEALYGNLTALNKLVEMLWQGTLIPQDKRMAISYLEKAVTSVTKEQRDELQKLLEKMQQEYKEEQTAKDPVPVPSHETLAYPPTTVPVYPPATVPVYPPATVPVYPPATVPVTRCQTVNTKMEFRKVLDFLIDVADELVDLHKSGEFHGNVSFEYMTVRESSSYGMEEGFIVACPSSGIRASAPESLLHNDFSRATDVFQFGLSILQLLTGENLQQDAKEIDIQTRLAQLTKMAANAYANLRAKIPVENNKSELIEVILRCLNLDYAQRPTMEDVAKQLRAVGVAMNYFNGGYRRTVKADKKARQAPIVVADQKSSGPRLG